MEEAVTFGTPSSVLVETQNDFYNNGSYRSCGGVIAGNPATGFLTAKLYYGQFTLVSGASKTVKIRFARL